MRFFAALVANVETAPKQNCPHPPLAFIQHELTLRSGWRSKQPWHSPMVIGLWCLYYPASQAGIEIFHRCRHHRLILTVEEAPRSGRGLTASPAPSQCHRPYYHYRNPLPMPGVASTSCSTQVLVNEHKLPHILASGPPPPPYTSRLAQSIVVLRAKQLTRSPSGASTVTQQSDRLPLIFKGCGAQCATHVWRKFGGALSASSIRKQKLQHMQYRALAVLLPTQIRRWYDTNAI